MSDKFNNNKPFITKRRFAVAVFGGIAVFLLCGFVADTLIQEMSPDPIAVDASGSSVP